MFQYTLGGKVLSQDGLVAWSDQPYAVKIEFEDAITSVNRLWYGENAHIEIQGERTAGNAEISVKGWSDSIGKVGGYPRNETVTPSFDGSLVITPQQTHSTVEVKASMLVNYPDAREKGFIDQRRLLERQFKLFVLSPEEMEFKGNLDTWRDKGAILAAIVFFLAGPGILLIGLGVLRLRDDRRRRAVSSP